MPTFDADARPIYVFEIDNDYHFSQYFEEQDLFNKLQEYYNGEKYRFEVPQEDFDEVTALLEEYYYEPVVVEEKAEF